MRSVHQRLGNEVPGAANGAVYTPPYLAKWVADELLRSSADEARTFFDFACGEGALLSAIEDACTRNPALWGSDIDSQAVSEASRRIPGGTFGVFNLFDACESGLSSLRETLCPTRDAAVILNPPWGISVDRSSAELRACGFELARGQFDSADLFLEAAIRFLKDGEPGAFILPDSLFFPDHVATRRFLLTNCTIDLIARIGEGFFQGVFRGTSVIVIRRGPRPSNHRVRCFRMSPEDRRGVMTGKTSFGDVLERSSHLVPQSRFERSASASFAVDVRQADLRHVKRVYERGSGWADSLQSGRGVELSKHGEVVRCDSCGEHRPKPRKPRLGLCSCGVPLAAAVTSDPIVRPYDGALENCDWKPLIAGVDVDRYVCVPTRQIRIGVPGINYKQLADPQLDRLLVRKTGVGLKAAIFRGDALTTQTVFHFSPTKSTPTFLLRYALGMMSSRIMLAVHLKRTGDNEWRSHPYVTQRMLSEFPIPSPSPGSTMWKQAEAIAERVTELNGWHDPGGEVDLQIESLVAGLFGFTSFDLAWVGKVLADAQALEGITQLRLPPSTTIEPVVVE